MSRGTKKITKYSASSALMTAVPLPSVRVPSLDTQLMEMLAALCVPSESV